jgi:hypothetical protein
MPRRDLSLAEQANVRALLRMLRVKLGGRNWLNVERALTFPHSTLAGGIRTRVYEENRAVGGGKGQLLGARGYAFLPRAGRSRSFVAPRRDVARTPLVSSRDCGAQGYRR